MVNNIQSSKLSLSLCVLKRDYTNYNSCSVIFLSNYQKLYCKLVEDSNAWDSVQQMMFISEFSGEAKFG